VLDECSNKFYRHSHLAEIKRKQLAFDLQKSPVEVHISRDDILCLKKDREKSRSLAWAFYWSMAYGLHDLDQIGMQ